jgi:hypothetical protein
MEECMLEFCFKDGSHQIFKLSKKGAAKVVMVLENDTVAQLDVNGTILEPKNILSVWQKVYTQV